MNSLVLVDTALRLPASDIEVLLLGRIIAAMPQIFIEPGRQFALYPSDTSINLLPLNLLYRSNFLSIAQNALTELGSETVLIKAWAKCEFCQVIDDAESLTVLSQLTVWTVDALQKMLLQRQHIFLAYLRVYELPHPVEVPVHTKGHFVPLPHSLNVTEASPVLCDRIFAQRRHQLETLQPAMHPELEELHGAIAQLPGTNQAAKELDQDVKVFLGWSDDSPVARPDPDLTWIETIAAVGNSSEGHDFEKLVRKSFIKLGFTNSNHNPKASLDSNATGGAGGIDFYCEAPYPVVGECKATKTNSVKTETPSQLVYLGMKNLGKEQYDRCIKLIVAAGQLNTDALKIATENQMSVIRPETLQSLIEMQAKHRGSVNLMNLKKCWQAPFGSADERIAQYLEQVRKDIAVRLHIVQLLKKHQKDMGIEYICGVYDSSNPPKPLLEREIHEILIELSSPLTGYLGRIKGSDWRRDRFYFLRDLPTD